MENKLRILVVDDDHMMARTIVDILKVKGHEAEAVHSGPEALEKVTQGSFGSAQDRPFGSAQDRPFDSAQDRREGTFEVYQDVRHNTWHLQI